MDDQKYLKCALHCHTNQSYGENVRYSPEKLLGLAAELGFDVVSISEHDYINYTPDLKNIAEELGILLIPAIEKTIKNKKSDKKGFHVLVVNPRGFDNRLITTTDDMRAYKKNYCDKDEVLVIAPHPFFYLCSINNDLYDHADLFDAFEYSFCWFGPNAANKKMIRIAEKCEKPVLGSGDVHYLWSIDKTYSLVKSGKNTKSFVKTIKNSRFRDCEIDTIDSGENHHNLGMNEKKIITKTERLTPSESFKIMKYLTALTPKEIIDSFLYMTNLHTREFLKLY